MEKKKRKRIRELPLLRVGYIYASAKNGNPPILIKSLKEISGWRCPTKAYTESGKPIENNDVIMRVVLSNGMITYFEKGTYRI